MIPILAWHKIDTRFEFGVTRIGPRLFRRQVEALAREGYHALGSAELAGALSGGSVPARPVVLTFDDGYAGLARHAFPVLADLGLRALVFVITDFVGRENSWDLRPFGVSFPHLSWDDLGRWQERGIEVHAHSASHARLTWLSDTAALDELTRSREAIAARLGRAPAVFCYPFGAVDPRVAALARQAGYQLGMAGANDGDPEDPMRLPRLMVYPWDRGRPPAILRSPLLRVVAQGVNRVALVTSALRRPGYPT